MNLLLQCVAEAVVEKGLRGLAEMVPGGGLIYDIAEGTWKRYRERCSAEEQRKEILELAQKNFDQAKQAAVDAVNNVKASEDIKPALELYLTQIPGAVRQSLKRPEDPSGKSVPPAFAMRNADDIAKLLPATLPSFKPGDALPARSGWILDRQIGVGGFGEVWLAKHPQFHSLIRAVKFCRNLQNRDRDMLHESKVIDRLLAGGSQTNIVKLLDVHLEGDTPWLLYEYIEAGDLADLIHTWANLAPKERQQKSVEALHELAVTIAYFHRLEPAIVHRDLKPANILRDKLGRLRITDFGISGIAAKAALENDKSGATTRAGRLQSYLRGSYTPNYASPQQRDGAEPDPRDDVHALGVIGYQMLTAQLIRGVGPDFVEDLKELEIEEQLIQALRACTAQKAERRPRDAGEFADLLKKLMSTPTKKPEPKGPPPPQPVKHDPYSDIVQDERDFAQALNLDGVKSFLSARAPGRIARWKEAALEGHAVGQHLYGRCLDWGTGITVNSAEAVTWYRRSADQGHAMAMYSMGGMYETGRGVAKDAVQAVAWYRKSAEACCAAAQNSLGLKTERGEGTAKDEVQALAWYRRSADQGFTWGINNVGVFYRDARAGLTTNDTEAVRWFKKAADLGLASGQFNLGWMYEKGRGIAKDDVQAVYWYRKAAEQGNSGAQCNLGWMYENGKGLAKDDSQAIYWYTKSADQGDSYAQCNLGWMHENGRGVAKDEVKAVEFYRKSADQGNSRAQCNLGWMYENGKGIARDYSKAYTWYKKAADQNFPDAQNNLGLLYDRGNGVPQDYKQAAHWFMKAANQNYTWGLNNIAMYYRDGLGGLPKDFAMAVSYFRKAADMGLAEAQNHLGIMYDRGNGVPQDDATALSWFRKAADQNYSWGLNNIGVYYRDGKGGLPKDDLQALTYFRRAANLNLASGQFNLGWMYEYGRGVPKDVSEAVSWYRKAAAQNDDPAKKALTRLGY